MSRITYLTIYNPQESSVNLLQNSIEIQLSKLQSEKLQESSLIQQIKLFESKISQLKLQKNETNSLIDLTKTLSALTKQAEASSSQLNYLHKQNLELKNQIEQMRIDGNNFRKYLSQLKQDLNDSAHVARVSSQSRLRIRGEDQTNKEKIQQILNRSTTEKAVLNEKLVKLHSNLLSSQREQVDSIKKHSEKIIQAINEPLQGIDLLTLMENQISFRTSKLSSLRKKLKKYKNRCKTLKNAFQQLAQTESPDFISVASQFIRSDQQLKDANFYLMNLNTEIESLQASNQRISASLHPTSSKPAAQIESLRSSLKSMHQKLSFTNFKSQTLSNTLQTVEILLSVTSKQQIFSHFSKIPEEKRTFSFFIPESASLEEKLSILSEVVHQCMMLKSYLSKKHSSFGTLHSSLLEPDSGLKTIKRAIKNLLIPDTPDSPENLSMLSSKH